MTTHRCTTIRTPGPTPRTRRRRTALPILALVLLAMPVLALHALSPVDLPETRIGEPVETPAKSLRTPDGDRLIVSERHRQLGRVYTVITTGEPQVRITSEAPLETINARSAGVVGYAIVGPPPLDAEEPRMILAGEFHLAVESIETGIKLRDEHLREPGWLDAANHPDIFFHFDRIEDPRVTQPPRDPAMDPVIMEATLLGTMTLRGTSRPIEIDNARFTFLPESDATRRVAPGDLLAIRCRYAIRMADFGVRQSIIGSTVAESVVLDQVLYLSTAPPASDEDAND